MSDLPLIFRNHEVRDLAWIFQGPGLLCERYFTQRCVGDRDLRESFRPYVRNLEALNNDPSPLHEFLAARPTGGRLGRYFENLFLYFLTQFKAIQHIESNLPIRDGKKTIGEIDFIYRETSDARPVHLEVSVKFYICVARNLEESLDPRFFVGTLIQDRLDRKIEKLFDRQIRLPENPAARARLAALNLDEPASKVLMKGCFFYPSSEDWQNHPHPQAVSPDHHRGWWTTSDQPLVPRKSEASRYIVLPFDRWLTPFLGESKPYPLYTHAELLSVIARRFDSSYARPLHYELGIAEVEMLNTESDPESTTQVREISRGNILHPKWPRHARGE